MVCDKCGGFSAGLCEGETCFCGGTFRRHKLVISISEPCPSCAELRAKVAVFERQIHILCDKLAGLPNCPTREQQMNENCECTCERCWREWSAAKAKEASNG